MSEQQVLDELIRTLPSDYAGPIALGEHSLIIDCARSTSTHDGWKWIYTLVGPHVTIRDRLHNLAHLPSPGTSCVFATHTISAHASGQMWTVEITHHPSSAVANWGKHAKTLLEVSERAKRAFPSNSAIMLGDSCVAVTQADTSGSPEDLLDVVCGNSTSSDAADASLST